MDITNWAKQSGNYLTAKDVNSNPNVPFIILSEGRVCKSEKFGTEKFEIEGEFNKVQKIISLSKTNTRYVADLLGFDTKKWIGKSLLLETYKTKTSDGKLTDAINVKATGEKI